ncbi:ankyrin repeat and SOCS box protein 11 [Denticeps clupeoides]|uniref:Ankyrin repeat and SOCS box protein 11 n=1 Tax=Denticeps clupeoides TaxID=299321 RepID=A0AAY4BK39_9TELE|nr:ankyrin repeat and SOCS box protein 11-like [Denticeps clupeoides]
MAAAQTAAWRPEFHVYGGRVANTLMADVCSDQTPLHEAALQGRLLLLRRLISQGLAVNISTLDGVTPLHEACAGGHFGCASTLLDHGANANAVTVHGATPLYYACCNGNPALASLILKHGSAHHPAHLLSSPIHAAAKRGHTASLKVLLSHGVNVDLELPGAGTPLYCACEAQRTECVHMLLLNGADVQRGRGLDTPLHAAARVGGAMEVELLLQHGADRACRDSAGRSVVELSAQNSRAWRLLQSTGADSLAQLCRLCIRRSLGRKRLGRTHTLYLPHTLHNYLLYQ